VHVGGGCTANEKSQRLGPGDTCVIKREHLLRILDDQVVELDSDGDIVQYEIAPKKHAPAPTKAPAKHPAHAVAGGK